MYCGKTWSIGVADNIRIDIHTTFENKSDHIRVARQNGQTQCRCSRFLTCLYIRTLLDQYLGYSCLPPSRLTKALDQFG